MAMAADPSGSLAPPMPQETPDRPLALSFISSLSGEALAELMLEFPYRHSGSEVAAMLPAVLPGHEYKLMHGDRVWASDQALADFLPTGSGEEQPRISTVVVKKANAQEEIDLHLIQAAGDLNVELIDKLLAAGASAAFVHDPEGVWGSQDKKTALHMALEARGEPDARVNIIKTLVAAGADVNAKRVDKDWRGCGGSHSAFEMLSLNDEDAPLFVLFLEAGADPNMTEETAVHSMRTDGHSKKYLLHKAVERESVHAVKALLDAGADVNSCSFENFENERGYNRRTVETALHAACRQKHLELAAILLERGADVDFQRQHLHKEEVELTEEQKVTDDPRASGFVPSVRCVPVRETALHMALLAGAPQLVALLVLLGADTTAPRHYGDVAASAEELCASAPELARCLGAASWTPEEVAAMFPEEKLRAAIERALARRADLRAAQPEAAAEGENAVHAGGGLRPPSL